MRPGVLVLEVAEKEPRMNKDRAIDLNLFNLRVQVEPVLGLVLPIMSIFGIGGLCHVIITHLFPRGERESNGSILLDSFLLGSLVVSTMLIGTGLILGGGFGATSLILLYTGLGGFVFMIWYWRERIREFHYKRMRMFHWVFLFYALAYLESILFSPPLRGWDALMFYFPNALAYVQKDSFLLGTNPLTYYPMFKPPLVSVLYGFVFASVGQFNLELVPYPYMIFTAYLCYRIAVEISGDEELGNFATVIVVALPFSFQFVLEYYYYQDMFLTAFTSAAIYYYIRYRKTHSSYYVVMSQVAVILSALTKMTGLIIFPFIILVFGDSLHRVISAVGLSAVTAFLVYKSIFQVYIGTALLVFAIGVYLVMSVLKNGDGLEDIGMRERIVYLSPGILWFVLAIVGAVFLTLRSGKLDFWLSYFFSKRGQEIVWTYPPVKNPKEEIWFEYTHHTSFLAGALFIFTAMVFVSGWVVYKVLGLPKAEKRFPFINRWMWFFFIIWITYFSISSSSRYLSFVFVPFSIVTALGIQEFNSVVKRKFDWDYANHLTVFAAAFVSFWYLYPTVPLEFVTLTHSLRLYYHHLYQLRLILYAVGFTVLTLGLLALANRFNKTARRGRVERVFVPFAVLLMFMPTILALMVTGYSVDNIRTDLFYHTRDNMNELVDFVNAQNLDEDALIISIDTPIIAYRTGHRTLDLMTPFLDMSLFDGINQSDLNEVLGVLNREDLQLFLYPRGGQLRYSFLEERYGYNHWLTRSIDVDRIFQPIFNNSEYIVYQYIPQTNFTGLASIGLVDPETGRGHSLLGYQEREMRVPNSYDVVFEFEGMSEITKIEISFVGDSNETYEYTLDTSPEQFFSFSSSHASDSMGRSDTILLRYFSADGGVQTEVFHVSEGFLAEEGDYLHLPTGYGLVRIPQASHQG